MLEMKVEKEKLRREMIKMRGAMTPAEVEEKSHKINALLLQIPEYAAANAIMFYVPNGNEVSIDEVIKEALASGKTILLPAASGQSLIPVEIKEYPEGIETGPLKMGQPKDKTEYTGKIDVAVIPGMAFTESGHRLGRGGGHYDRMLEARKFFRIGVAYESQMRTFPAEAHDQLMDVIVTESRAIRCRQ